jgi:hypothetical protein
MRVIEFSTKNPAFIMLVMITALLPRRGCSYGFTYPIFFGLEKPKKIGTITYYKSFFDW